MAPKLEKTCLCIKDLSITDEYNDGTLNFHMGREYQVDIYPLFNVVYQNGGWKDFVYLNDEEFYKNFKLIE